MIRRPVQKQDHERILFAQLVHVRQKVFRIAVGFLPEQLRPVIGQSAEQNAAAVRARSQHYWPAALDRPHFAKLHVVNENAFVLNYGSPLDFVKTRQVGRVFFKNALRSLSFEWA